MKQFNDLVLKGEVIYRISPEEIKELKIYNMMVNRRSQSLVVMLENDEFLEIRGNEYWVIKENIIFTPNKNLLDLITFVKQQQNENSRKNSN